MSNFPFVRIEQNEEVFYLTKMPISFLKDHVNFHFRTTSNENDIQYADEYIKSLESKLGDSADITSGTEGIQRRTN